MGRNWVTVICMLCDGSYVKILTCLRGTIIKYNYIFKKYLTKFILATDYQ